MHCPIDLSLGFSKYSRGFFYHRLEVDSWDLQLAASRHRGGFVAETRPGVFTG
jgi:hypothetical protein